MNKKFGVQTLALIGVMSALVFAASWIQIQIPTAIDNTRLHLGNVMCLLSGILLGPVSGGFAAGIGSMFFDFTNPAFIKDAVFTFAFKFIMAFICGVISWSGGAQGSHLKRNFLAAGCGAFSYVILYLSKNFILNYFFLRMELSPVLLMLGEKALVSTINAVVSVIITAPLAAAIRKSLRTGFLP